MQRINDPQMSPEFQHVASSFSNEEQILVRQLNKQTIAGYTLLNDIYGKPILVLKADIPREIYEQGKTSVSYFVLALLIVGLIFGVVIMWLLEHEVLTPLSSLSNSVISIGETGNISTRLSVPGKSELSSLADEINEMLKSLEKSQEEIKKVNEELEKTNRDLKNEITERKQAEKTIKRRFEFEKTVSNISARFVGVSDIDDAIEASLSDMGRLSGSSRVYVFIFSEDGTKMSNTHEWCVEGVSPEIDNLQNLPCEMFPWWMKKLHKGEVIHIGDASKLPLEAKALKEILESQNIKSLLVLPLYGRAKLIGFIGFDNVVETGRWSADNELLLHFSSGILGNAFERKRTEEELERNSNELEKSNKLKDLFIDIMEHDLLNPATASKHMAELSLKTEEDPEKIETFEILFRTNDRIIEMIQNASLLAKLESGEKLKFNKIDLGTILRSAINENTQLADKKKMKISIIADGTFKVMANPLIQSVFSNFLSNAIKYSPENSGVTVRIDNDGSNWKISVADHGEGIPEKYKETIFDRFKRIEKEGVKGTGLGLAIVKEVVEAHNGKAWVEDNIGGGSIFITTLPKEG